MTQSAAERYIRLGLQLGRHVDGIVDAYFGSAEPAAAVDAEPPVEPRALVAAAEALLDELEDGWLRDQVVGLRTYAGVLAGESRSYADEVEGATACGRRTPTRPCSRPRTSGSTSCSPAPGRWRSATTAGRTRSVSPPSGSSPCWSGSSRRRAGGRADCSGSRTASASSSRSCTTRTGGPPATTSAGCAAGSPSTSTSRCRPSTCSCSRCTRHIRATTPSAAARTTCWCAGAGCSRRRSSWCRRRSRSSRRASPRSRRTCYSRATPGRRSPRWRRRPASSSISATRSRSCTPASRAGGPR
jgi:hypothetical protein